MHSRVFWIETGIRLSWKLYSLKGQYQWHVLKEIVQYDGWACGIWCTLFLEFFLKCKDPTKFTFKKTGIFTNASNHANKVSNAYAIKRYGLAIEEI